MPRAIEDKKNYCNVSFETTKNFRDEIKAKAKSQGLNQSEYIRNCLRKALQE